MKILLVNQASVLKTGYGVFGKSLLSHLYKKYQVAELGCDIRSNDPRLNSVPWKIYGNLPKNAEEENVYKNTSLSMFGANIFEDVCLDFQPTHIISINDNWAASYIGKHYYNRFYNFIYMPTLDAQGISKEWFYDFSMAEKLLTYQDWSANVLKNESKLLNSIGSAPYIPDLKPTNNRQQIKNEFGIDGFIIGTVMRNQARKRFPELFSAFSKLIKNHNNIKLYCHTSYPDFQGWNIPQLLLKYNIAHLVYFSYICQECRFIWPSVYKSVPFCPKCKNRSGIMCNANFDMPIEIMEKMYSVFDIYVQFVNAEGLGMPMLESAACGTPVIGTDYASLKDVIPKISGQLINCQLQQEITSDRLMAIPDENHFIELMNNILNMSQEDLLSWRCKTRTSFEENYKLSESLKIWEKAFDCNNKSSWKSPEEIFQIPSFSPSLEKMKNSDFIRWCILNILHIPNKLNTYFENKLISELDLGYRTENKINTINKEQIFNEFCNIRNYYNFLEKRRTQ